MFIVNQPLSRKKNKEQTNKQKPKNGSATKFMFEVISELGLLKMSQLPAPKALKNLHLTSFFKILVFESVQLFSIISKKSSENFLCST